MMYHFFQYKDLFPLEYQGLTQICCHIYTLKSTFEPSGTLVLQGEAFVFANLYRFCSKLAEYHWLAQQAKYKSFHMAINTKDHVSFLLQKY